MHKLQGEFFFVGLPFSEKEIPKHRCFYMTEKHFVLFKIMPAGSHATVGVYSETDNGSDSKIKEFIGSKGNSIFHSTRAFSRVKSMVIRVFFPF